MKNCPKRTFRSDFVKLGSEIFYYFWQLNCNLFCFVVTQTPRGQELLGHIKKEWQIKMMACFSSSLMKRVLNFMRNPEPAHVLVYNECTR